MALTAAETEQAREIVKQLVWQPANGHIHRYSKAVNTLTRFCEAASMEPDVARLVIEYLKNEVITDGISLLNKMMDFGSGWMAIDAWYQTAEGEKFAGTESTKVRIYQVLMQPPTDGELMGEHELTAIEHSDMKTVALFDDSEDTPEPQTLTVEDVTGVTNPLPIAEGADKPEGFSGDDDQAGGGGRKIVRKRIVVNEETGRRDRQIIERTSIPYKKNMSWTDDNAAHHMLVFRNQKTVPQISATFTIGTTTYTASDISPSVSINEFGLFDGVYHYTCRIAGSGSPETSGTWDKLITIKERYVKPGGKTFCRTYTVTKYVFHGAASGAINHYLEGTEYPGLGLHSWKTIHGQRGDAEWYGSDLTLTADGPEPTSGGGES